jgi:lysophospholipid acyltransferase (LPLAT)-like uncharacterized protein
MGLWKNLGRKRWIQVAVGVSAAEYLRFVAFANRRVIEPADIYERVARDLPVIFAMWHGQQALVPFIRRPEHRAKALISRHRDGELNAVALEWLGVEGIRGSGDHGGEFHRKGGVGAFRAMLTALGEGHSMVLTADVPKVGRVAGLGIAMLAGMSGRPIYPVAVATSRRVEFDSWDRSVLNLPFGPMAAVVGAPIRVAAEAGDGALEAARQQVEDELNDATARAYALAERRGDTQRG